MKKLKFKKIFLDLVIITSMFFQNTVFADELKYKEKEESLIIMKNGTTLHANILEKKSGKLLIYTKDLGNITIDIENVKEIKFTNITKDNTEINTATKENEKYTKKWFDNPTDTRLFLSPTARMLKKGSGYFQDIDIFVATANYGITDNISIGAMGTLIPYIGLESQVFAITPKFGYEITKDLSIAGSILYGSGPNSTVIGQFGLGYGAATYGNADNNLTIGFGSGLYSSYGSNTYSTQLVIIGGMYRVSEYISVLSENWFILNSNTYFPSLGMRFFGEKLSADLGFIAPSSGFGQAFTPIPYIDFVFSF